MVRLVRRSLVFSRLVSPYVLMNSRLCCLSLQATPPLYDATAMHVPVALYWAQNDWLADPTDVRMLLKLLPNQLYNKYIPHWDHLDFIWGLDAATVVYDDVIAHIRGEQ